MATAAQKKAQQAAKVKAEANQAQAIETLPGLRVTTKVDGFRRGGREWNGTTEVLESEFTDEQLEQLVKEPKLIIQQIEIAV